MTAGEKMTREIAEAIVATAKKHGDRALVNELVGAVMCAAHSIVSILPGGVELADQLWVELSRNDGK